VEGLSPRGLGMSQLWSVLLSRDARGESNESLLRGIHGLGRMGGDPVWAVVLLRSGKFAGAVFQGTKALVHKVRGRGLHLKLWRVAGSLRLPLLSPRNR
jgi:hypothetical protein